MSLLAKVPNTAEGRKFLKQFNKFLVKGNFHTYRKPRHSKRKQLQKRLGIPTVIDSAPPFLLPNGTLLGAYECRNSFVPAAHAEYFSVFVVKD